MKQFPTFVAFDFVSQISNDAVQFNSDMRVDLEVNLKYKWTNS